MCNTKRRFDKLNIQVRRYNKHNVTCSFLSNDAGFVSSPTLLLKTEFISIVSMYILRIEHQNFY